MTILCKLGIHSRLYIDCTEFERDEAGEMVIFRRTLRCGRCDQDMAPISLTVNRED